MQYRNLLFLLIIALAFNGCAVKRHSVINTEQHTDNFRLQNTLQTKVLLDSMLQSVDFSADSVIILVTPSVPSYPSELVREDRERTAAAPNSQSEFPSSEQVLTKTSFSLNSPPSIRITAHNPQIKKQKQKNTLVLTQQVEQDSVASKTSANSHADVSNDTVGVARPAHSTTAVLIIAILLIAIMVGVGYFAFKKIIWHKLFF